jgi:hypothetical protein
MTERVTLCSEAGVVAAPSTPFPPLGMAKRGGTGVNEDDENKTKEEDEDEYRAPYLACQISCVKTWKPEVRTP